MLRFCCFFVTCIKLLPKLIDYVREKQKERRKSLTDLLIHLRSTKRLQFITIKELGARYAEFYRSPLLIGPGETIYSIVNVDPQISIKGQYHIWGFNYSIMHLQDQPLQNQVIRINSMDPLQTDEEVVIGDVHSNGDAFLVRKSIYDSQLVELHQKMKARYEADRKIDKRRITDYSVCDFVACQVIAYPRVLFSSVFRLAIKKSGIVLKYLESTWTSI